MIAAVFMLAAQAAIAGNVLTDMFRYECKHASADRYSWTCHESK